MIGGDILLGNALYVCDGDADCDSWTIEYDLVDIHQLKNGGCAYFPEDTGGTLFAVGEGDSLPDWRKVSSVQAKDIDFRHALSGGKVIALPSVVNCSVFFIACDIGSVNQAQFPVTASLVPLSFGIAAIFKNKTVAFVTGKYDDFKADISSNWTEAPESIL